MKRIFTYVYILIIFITAALFFGLPAAAETGEDTSSEMSAEQLYDEQLKASGAGELDAALPEEYKEIIWDMGVKADDPSSITDVGMGNVFSSIINSVMDKAAAPIKSAAAIIAAIILCAMCSGVATESANKQIGVIFTYVSALVVGIIVIKPVTELALSSIDAIKICSAFMAAFIPVFAGILIASGKIAAAASAQTVLFTATQIAGQAASAFIGPFISLYFGLAVTSSLSEEVKLNGICETVKKAAIWILGLIMTVFTAFLTIQNVINGAADSVTSRAAKFAAGTFVPVVGTYISESLSTVQACLSLVKSGVGMYAVLAMLIIILPHIIALLFWKLSVECGAAAADMFSLTKITGLLKAVSSGISLLIALMSCFGILFIVCTGITVLTAGGV